MTDNINIEVNGQFIDLNEASIRLEKVNPFFEDAIYQGDYSFPFTIPATDKNLKIFGFVNFIDTSEKTLRYDAFLYLFGQPAVKTVLIVKKAQKRNLQIVLTSGVTSLKSRDKKLSEIPLGDDYFLGNETIDISQTATAASVQGNWQTYGFTFVPHKAENYYADKNPDFNGVINQTDSTTGEILCYNSNSMGNPHTLVPFLFLFYVLNKVFEYEELVPGGSFWNHPEYKTLLLSNNYEIAAGDKDGNVRAVIAGGFDNSFQNAGERVFFQVGPADSYDNNGSWSNVGGTGSFYTINKIGKTYINVELIADIGNVGTPGEANNQFPTFLLLKNGVELARCEFDLVEPVGFTKRFMSYEFTAAPGDLGETIIVEYYWGPYAASVVHCDLKLGSFITITADKPTNRLASYLSFKNHVSDLTCGELIAEVRKLGVNFDFDFKNHTVTLDTVDFKLAINEFIKLKVSPNYEIDFDEVGKGIVINYEFDETENPTITLPPDQFKGEFLPGMYFPQPDILNDWAIATDTNQVWQVGKQAVTFINEWQPVGFWYPQYKIGAGEKELTCRLSPMQMTHSANTFGTSLQNEALMPITFGKGSSPLFGIGLNPAPMRLVFWRGRNILPLQSNNRGGIYIVASTGIYGINGNIIGETNFRLDQPNGFIIKHTDKLYQAINRAEFIEKDLYMDAIDALSIKNFSKADFDYNIFLIKSISIFVSKYFTRAKAYLLKL